VYPKIAQSARVQGVVILEATIGPDGSVQDAKVLRSIPLLDQAAVDAVKQWQFAPTLLNGAPVPVIMTVTVNFTLYDPEVPARPCAEEASMKSPDSTTQRVIQFVNASATPRKVYWLDATGERKLYQTVAAGAAYRQDTFAGHVWVVTDEHDVCRAVYLATTGDQATLR
jgi:TonB family protein